MKKNIEEHEKEALLILITMLGVARWWVPTVSGFQNMYSASHWVLSYDFGLIRRGLIGSIIKMWLPIVTIENVYHIALIAYCTFLVLLLIIFYAILRYKDKGGRLFRLILLFLATPATLSMYGRYLGSFDIFLIMIMFLSLIVLSLNRHIWLIPVLMVTAMFIHEGFLILCAPTIVAALIFVYFWDKKEKRILVTLGFSAISVMCVFLVLYKFGDPTLGYEEFSRFIQSRATFYVTDLSMRECFFGVKDHFGLTSPYLHDAGSIINLFLALLILSPVILVLLNLWTHAIRNCGAHKTACQLLFLSSLSGLMLLPIATDYGRWLSAIIFCNFFAIFFLISRDVIKVEGLAEYEGGSFPMLYVLIIFTYLFFGPLHDCHPYPYQQNLIYSSLSIILVLLFDIGFCIRWLSAKRVITS